MLEAKQVVIMSGQHHQASGMSLRRQDQEAPAEECHHDHHRHHHPQVQQVGKKNSKASGG